MNGKQQIIKYIGEATRNKVVFCQSPISGIEYTNVGLIIATWLEQQDKAEGLLDSVIIDQVFQSGHYDAEIGKYTALQNIGILFEPQLKLNVRSLIEANSRNQCLIITSNGEVEGSHYFFLKSGSPYQVNLDGLSFIQIKQS